MLLQGEGVHTSLRKEDRIEESLVGHPVLILILLNDRESLPPQKTTSLAASDMHRIPKGNVLDLISWSPHAIDILF